MDGLEWTASAMGAAERGLQVATENLAGAPCDGFHRMLLSARISANGIATTVLPDEKAGALRRTNRELDLTVTDGARMRLSNGTTCISASCERTTDEHLRTQDGLLMNGLHGALRFPLESHIDQNGNVLRNGAVIDRIALTRSGRIEHGVVEAANTDSMQAMIDVLEAQRHFETAQKTAQTLDAVAAKDASEVGRTAQ